MTCAPNQAGSLPLSAGRSGRSRVSVIACIVLGLPLLAAPGGAEAPPSAALDAPPPTSDPGAATLSVTGMTFVSS